MKKITFVGLAALSLMSLNFAQADRIVCNEWGYDCHVIHHHHDDDDDNGSLIALLASLYTTTTTDNNDDDRAIYIQNVQDDAAAYLAGGEESALLQEAIQQLRTQKGITGTDSEIASDLISE